MLFIKIKQEITILFYRESFVYICTRRDDVRRIQQRYFIYRSIFAISELRKRRVQGHCAAYHFRMNIMRITKFTKKYVIFIIIVCQDGSLLK